MSLNLAGNNADSLSYLQGEIAKDCVETAVGISRCTPFVLECNVDSEIRPVHLHVRRRTAKNQPRNLCAVFDFTAADEELLKRGSEIPSTFATQAKLPLNDIGFDEIKQTVLVRVIEVAQKTQQRREVFVWAIVRLKGLDFCLNACAKGANHSAAVFGELGSDVVDGKLQFVPPVGRVLSRLMDGDGVNQMVESTSKIVDCISDHQRPSVEAGGFANFENDAVDGAIIVTLVNKAVRFSVKPGLNLFLDGVSMYLTPIDFGVYTGEV